MMLEQAVPETVWKNKCILVDPPTLIAPIDQGKTLLNV